MKIDDDLIRRTAKLAGLELSDEEISTYRGQLAQILEHVGQLGTVNVDGVEPLAHPGGFTDVLREDDVRNGLPNEAALKNAPRRADGFFIVPRVVEE